MFAALLGPTRRLLDESGVALTLVDVGARNGVIELADLAPYVDAHGFEPNPVEYEKLLTGDTGTALIGIAPPPYASLRHHPYALGDREGRATLYLTRAAGAAGLREPDATRLREIVWKAKPFPHSLAEDYFEVVGTEEVELRTLRSVASEAGLAHVDYLKVDVEGTAYEVLEGAGELLERTGVIRAEVEFVPFRKGQKLFSHVDLLVRERGFDLLRYELSPHHIGYKVRRSPTVWGSAFGFPDRYGQPLHGDAVYVNRELRDPARAVAQAAVLIDKNYLDEAAFVLRKRAGGGHEQLVELLRTHSDIRPQHRLMRFGVDVLELARKARRPRSALSSWRGWRLARAREGARAFDRFAA